MFSDFINVFLSENSLSVQEKVFYRRTLDSFLEIVGPNIKLSQIDAFSVYQSVRYRLSQGMDPDMLGTDNEYLASFVNWLFDRENLDKRLFFKLKKTHLESLALPISSPIVLPRYLWTFLIWIEEEKFNDEVKSYMPDGPFIVWVSNVLDANAPVTNPARYNYLGTTLSEFFSCQDFIFLDSFVDTSDLNGPIHVPKNAFSSVSENINPKYLSRTSRVLRFVLRDFEETPAFSILKAPRGKSVRNHSSSAARKRPNGI
jgi:hypothetical protein